MNSPDAGGVTSAGAMRPFVRILWPLVDDVQVDVVAGADAVQRGNLRLRRVPSLHTAPLPGRLGRARNILLVYAMQPPAGSLPRRLLPAIVVLLSEIKPWRLISQNRHRILDT